MVLADTSVWIDHFRDHSARLAGLLDRQQVLIHPFVIGELACGGLENRKEILSLLQALPSATKADEGEVLLFIDRHRLMRRGLGLIDMHLLASCRLSGCMFWTEDRKLRAAAKSLGLLQA